MLPLNRTRTGDIECAAALDLTREQLVRDRRAHVVGDEEHTAVRVAPDELLDDVGLDQE